MSKFFYDGRFIIKKINYENIIENFNIFVVSLNYKELEDQKNYSILLNKVRNLKNLKSFYLKDKIYLLGAKDFQLNDLDLVDCPIYGSPTKILEKSDLEKIDNLVLLTLLTRYIPYKILNRITEKDNKIRYVDTNSIYFFLKQSGNIFKFLSCSFEKYKFGDEYLVSLTQKTFAHESLFIVKPQSKKIKKIGYDSASRLLIPDEKGSYYERNPFTKTVETSFILRATDDLTKLRSYYLTLIKEMIEDKLKKYIILKFKTLSKYEHFDIKSNKSFFATTIKNIERNVDVYKIKDIKDGKEIIASGEDIFIKNLEDFKLKKINFNLKGIAEISSPLNNLNNWKLFLLNSNTGDDLDYDGYKEIKKSYNLLSNGFSLNEEVSFEVSLTRIIEELFIKEQLKNKSILNLHSNPSLFEGVSCIHYKNEKIRKLTVLNNGKIDILSCEKFKKTQLSEEFNQLLHIFELEENFYKFPNKSSDLKFIKIEKKTIYIAETGMRLYFDSTEYLKEYMKEREKGNKSVSRSLQGFLGMSMAIRINTKEQLYYSFYDTGIKDRETFAPNIKKLISKDKLTIKEYTIFCESLVFKYLSNPAKLASYPFFFKLTSEM